MRKAEKGDKVRVHYTGKLSDGSVFDSSRERDPLEFEIGSGQVIPGFESGVVGMAAGDTQTVEIAVEDAYGERNKELIWEVDKGQLPDGYEPQIGEQLQSVQEDGRRINVFIIDVSEKTVTLDANHPLAGRDLTFELELVEIL